MNFLYEAQLEKWHQFIASQGAGVELLAEIVAQDAVFRSPVVWTPQLGKAITLKYLVAAAHVLKNFKYTRTLFNQNAVCLQFNATVGEISIVGIDLIEFNEAGLIKDFEVMVRPAKALQVLGEAMREQLTSNAA